MVNRTKPNNSNKDNGKNPASNVAIDSIVSIMSDIEIDLMLDSDNGEQYADKINRLEQAANRVTFTSGNNGVVRVMRLTSENIAIVNRANKQHGLVFNRVFVADYRTEYKGESLRRRLGAIGIVENESGKRAYLLGSTWIASIKTRGELQDKLNNMLATVQKAIHLATTHGIYDEYNMSYDNSKSKDNGERAFVHAVIEF